MLNFYEGNDDDFEDPGDPDAADVGPGAGAVAKGASAAAAAAATKSKSPSPALKLAADKPATVPTVMGIRSLGAPPPPPQASAAAAVPLVINQQEGEAVVATLGLRGKHPVTALFEFCLRMKLPKPVFSERQVGTAWAFDVQLGDGLVISNPAARPKKKEARSEVARLCLKQLGIYRPATSSPVASKQK